MQINISRKIMISKPDYPELLRIILFVAVTQILSLPALMDAVSGLKGASPAAIRSALMNFNVYGLASYELASEPDMRFFFNLPDRNNARPRKTSK